MSERDREVYAKRRADPEKYAAYLERKRKESRVRQKERSYETLRKRTWRKKNAEATQRIRKAGHAVEKAVRNGELAKPSSCSPLWQ